MNKNQYSDFLYSISQVRELEKIAFDKYKITPYDLMKKAGNSVFKEIRKRWPTSVNILIICGKGNNAGDGYVVASLAKRAGLNVTILQLFPDANLVNPAKQAFAVCKKLKINIKEFDESLIANADLIVDAILGIGFSGKLNDKLYKAICSVNSSLIPIISIDVPSGIDADTGSIDTNAICATLTVTFVALKVGLYIGHARDYTGEIVYSSLNINNKFFEHIKPHASLLNLNKCLALLPNRTRNSHKGDFGTVLIIGGDSGMSGAPKMAAMAAARVGCGRVIVATKPCNVFAIAATYPELMVHGIDRKSRLLNLIDKASIIVIGPGLGVNSWGLDLFSAIQNAKQPIILDADALNLLACYEKNVSLNFNNFILTPHAGEAARLLNTNTASIIKNPLCSAQALLKKFGGVVVLKSAGTVVATSKELPYICNNGNPGMASGGMGDVLSGIIGGLVSQGINLFDAAKLGVILHASAGDLSAKIDGKRGMLATDLLPLIRNILNFSKYREN